MLSQGNPLKNRNLEETRKSIAPLLNLGQMGTSKWTDPVQNPIKSNCGEGLIPSRNREREGGDFLFLFFFLRFPLQSLCRGRNSAGIGVKQGQGCGNLHLCWYGSREGRICGEEQGQEEERFIIRLVFVGVE